MTYETNIYLTKENKTRLTKMARAKYLSLSTYIDIIVEHYFSICHKKALPTYIEKGTEQTHIKLRNKNQNKLTPIIISNCISVYLNPSKAPAIYEKLALTKINKQIQSKADKTIDNNYNYNELCRAIYRAERERK